MSKIYDQVIEITRFLLNNSVKDVDSLYKELVSNKDEEDKIECFIEREVDVKERRFYYKDISKNKFKRSVTLMDKLNFVNTDPLELLNENSKVLQNFKAEKFDNLLEEIVKEYFAKHDFDIPFLREKVIKKIKYPDLRNTTTIHKRLKNILKSEKTIGLQDFAKLITLLSDIGVLERKSTTIFF